MHTCAAYFYQSDERKNNCYFWALYSSNAHVLSVSEHKVRLAQIHWTLKKRSKLDPCSTGLRLFLLWKLNCATLRFVRASWLAAVTRSHPLLPASLLPALLKHSFLLLLGRCGQLLAGNSPRCDRSPPERCYPKRRKWSSAPALHLFTLVPPIFSSS